MFNTKAALVCLVSKYRAAGVGMGVFASSGGASS